MDDNDPLFAGRRPGARRGGLMGEAEPRPAAPARAEPPLTVLREGDTLRGRLEALGDVHLLGTFEGEVSCAGEIIVGKDARVAAELVTVDITISGHVRGDVVARGRLKLTAGGRLEGDARVASLIVQQGGVHLGDIRVHPEGLPAGPAPGDPAPGGAAAEAAPGRGLGWMAGAPGRPLAASVQRARKLWTEFF